MRLVGLSISLALTFGCAASQSSSLKCLPLDQGGGKRP